MGVTSLPLHNLRGRGSAVIVLPGCRSPGGKSSGGRAVAHRLAAFPPRLIYFACELSAREHRRVQIS